MDILVEKGTQPFPLNSDTGDQAQVLGGKDVALGFFLYTVALGGVVVLLILELVAKRVAKSRQQSMQQ